MGAKTVVCEHGALGSVECVNQESESNTVRELVSGLAIARHHFDPEHSQRTCVWVCDCETSFRPETDGTVQAMGLWNAEHPENPGSSRLKQQAKRRNVSAHKIPIHSASINVRISYQGRSEIILGRHDDSDHGAGVAHPTLN